MRYFPNRIICKSTPSNWEKQKSGKKNNTVRKITDEEKNSFNLIINHLLTDNVYITIENTETGEYFERKISDISQFQDNIYIISFETRYIPYSHRPIDFKCPTDSRFNSEL